MHFVVEVILFLGFLHASHDFNKQFYSIPKKMTIFQKKTNQPSFHS